MTVVSAEHETKYKKRKMLIQATATENLRSSCAYLETLPSRVRTDETMLGRVPSQFDREPQQSLAHFMTHALSSKCMTASTSALEHETAISTNQFTEYP